MNYFRFSPLISMVVRLLCFVSMLCFSTTLRAQNILTVHGMISDNTTGKGVPHATLYVKETQSGAVANDDGHFVLHLAEGRYTIIVRSLGYGSIQSTVDISAARTDRLGFSLTPVAYALGGVTVDPNRGEDPAYAVMRRVMSRTPMYEKMLQSYTARTYTKGSMKLEKLPFFLREVRNEGVAMKELIGKRFVVEGELETKYSAPDTYSHHTLSMRSSIPEELDRKSKKGLGTLHSMISNVYGKNIGLGDNGSIPSPIRFNGLYQYKYKLQGINTDGDETVYHISYADVEGQFSKGELWISDKAWMPIRLTAQMSIMGAFKQDLEVTLNPVEDDIYLPTSYILDMDVSVIGAKMNFKYYSSTSYRDMHMSDAIRAIRDKRLSEMQKVMPEDAVFASMSGLQKRKLNKKLTEIELNMDTLGTQARDRFMVPTVTRKIEMSVDTLAYDRDSTYWERVITAPLSKDELESYLKRDSIKTEFEKRRVFAPKKEGERTGGSPLATILFGYDKKLSSKWTLGVNGLLGMLFNNYRYSDGLWLGPTFFVKYANSSDTNPVSMEIRPSVYYTTKHDNVYWDIDAQLNYAGMRRGKLSFRAGRHSDDIGGEKMNFSSNLANAYFTLYDGRYSYQFYDKTYFRAGNKIDLFNGLNLEVGVEHRHSAPLPNETVWGIVKPEGQSYLSFQNARDPHPFKNYYSMPDHHSNTFDVKLTFNATPYYKIVDGRKQVLNEYDMDEILSESFSVTRNTEKNTVEVSVKTSAPTGGVDWRNRNNTFFTLHYKHAVPRANSIDSDYSLLTASLYGRTYLSLRYALSYRFSFGVYPHRTKMYADDMYYVKRANLISVNRGDFLFHTLPPYTAVGEMFATGGIYAPLPNIVSNLFGRLKVLGGEGLVLKGYWDKSRSDKLFLEAGYNLALPMGITLGVYYGGYGFKEDRGVAIRSVFTF
ncbi:DUF5686 and carboxypeptidase-like regulatory domain-containing protein [Porphyromonas sp.]|uniref:DUF5686 and carboxypeptidase-like regulatory domain-containing protein n=1 Tax=Porphyromonas sp. TaxID=1924944 RepID=UPI0026DA884D|nr:DUF5686 and carboxypeptidase-like regulatory domain-containing protein [Porphyromonas sp.]MDO4770301.1 DUF5686 family protein [Porphyromonas sp.]